jgi:RNA polymerase sigma-70 factor (ECF subfamily)
MCSLGLAQRPLLIETWRAAVVRVLHHARRAPGDAPRAHEPRRYMSDDAALIERVSRGDGDAFAQLYDRHAALVFGVARRILGNPTQAEDVAQSVFLQVWSRPASFQGGNFSAWVATVARNASIDILRSAAVRTREPEMPIDLPSNVDLDDEVFGRVRASAVNEALRALPADQRDAIERAYFEGLSYREVAEKLGEPLGTIKSRIRAGLRRLLDALSEVQTT